MSQNSIEEKNRIKRVKSEVAIRLAGESRWEEAVILNRELLSLFPEDAETFNRLGKAYLELKKYGEAKACYEKAAKFDQGNIIAKKNLQRLHDYKSVAAATEPLEENSSGTIISPTPGTHREKVSASIFIEETGKTGTTSLTHVAPVAILAKVTAGDTVQLEADHKSQTLSIKSSEGETLGQVEARLALRLLKFMEAGNRYTAVITSVTETAVKVIIRETYQHPSMRGKLSFPPKATPAIRGYTRDSLVRGGMDDEAYIDMDSDDDDDGDGGDDDNDMTDDYPDEPEQEEI